jgi:hypothetical protein
MRGECILTVSFLSLTMKEGKLIAETQDTLWIWIIPAMIVKWLNYTIKFYFTSGYCVQQRYQPRRMKNEDASRKLIRGWSHSIPFIIYPKHRGNPYLGVAIIVNIQFRSDRIIQLWTKMIQGGSLFVWNTKPNSHNLIRSKTISNHSLNR